MILSELDKLLLLEEEHGDEKVQTYLHPAGQYNPPCDYTIEDLRARKAALLRTK